MAARCGAGAVYVTGDFGPYGSARDEDVAWRLQGREAGLRVVDSAYAVPPGHPDSIGRSVPGVHPLLPGVAGPRLGATGAPTRPRPSQRAGLGGDLGPDAFAVEAELPETGEEAAHRRLDSFLCPPPAATATSGTGRTGREFHADVLHHRPDAARSSYRPEWRTFEVDRGRRADQRSEAWTQRWSATTGCAAPGIRDWKGKKWRGGA